ncbi:MAG: hypothetical protein WD670_08705, partial [Actinomycetota bacterium]
REGRVDLGDATYDLVDPGSVVLLPTSVTVHGLRPVDLRGARDLDTARASLGAAIAGRFLVTWAAGVEAGFLDRLYGGGARRWLRRCIDVRPIALALDEHPRFRSRWLRWPSATASPSPARTMRWTTPL